MCLSLRLFFYRKDAEIEIISQVHLIYLKLKYIKITVHLSIQGKTKAFQKSAIDWYS